MYILYWQICWVNKSEEHITMCNHFAIANCGDQVSENAVAVSIRDSQGYFEFTTDTY